MKLEQLTLEEAKQYVSCQDDFSSDGIENASFFTLTPEEDGWEIVTYYTPRKINIYSNRNKEYDSWVYVLSNPSFKDMLKIGYTKNAPELRSEQLYKGTGVPTPFKLEFAKQCLNGEMLEKLTHKYLKKDRVNNEREFFYTKLDDVIVTINKLHADLEANEWTI